MGETLKALRELEKIFSDDFDKKEKLTKLIEDIAYVKRLLGKLSVVIDRYGKSIDEKNKFFKPIKKI